MDINRREALKAAIAAPIAAALPAEPVKTVTADDWIPIGMLQGKIIMGNPKMVMPVVNAAKKAANDTPGLKFDWFGVNSEKSI